MNCVGYNKPGPSGTEVNCLGDCASGKGYCYSSGDGLSCNQCVLYSPAAGEQLCTDHGSPLGLTKQLPGGADFGSSCQSQWTSSGGPAKIDMPCSGRAMRTEPELRVFA